MFDEYGPELLLSRLSQTCENNLWMPCLHCHGLLRTISRMACLHSQRLLRTISRMACRDCHRLMRTISRLSQTCKNNFQNARSRLSQTCENNFQNALFRLSQACENKFQNAFSRLSQKYDGTIFRMPCQERDRIFLNEFQFAVVQCLTDLLEQFQGKTCPNTDIYSNKFQTAIVQSQAVWFNRFPNDRV